MSTIASPRASTSIRDPSSSRTSLDTVPTSSRSQTTPTAGRRNRAALRDYYGLKSPQTADTSSSEALSNIDVEVSELDREGFDAETYVQELLTREGLEGILKAESGLLSGMSCKIERSLSKNPERRMG